MTPHTILVAGEDLAFREIQIMAANPMGRQILTAAGAEITPESVVLQLLPSGELEAIRLDEHANLVAGNRFLLSAADRSYYFTVDGTRLEWPHRCISARAARVVAEVSDDRDICIERQSGHLVALKDDDLVDLGKPGCGVTHLPDRGWPAKAGSHG